jgi:hypothetical protein
MDASCRAGAEECPPKRCQCELNPDGQPAGGTLRGAGERCFNLKAHDHHAHVLLELRTSQPGLDAPLQLLGVTANRKGPRYEHAWMGVEMSEWNKVG